MNKHDNQENQSLQEMLEKEGLPSFITHPQKEDIILWSCLLVITILSFSLIPFRVWFLNNPEWYALIIGGYTSSTLIGAYSATGQSHGIFILLTIIGALKFIPVYFYIGKRWGKEFINYSLQYTPKTQKWMNLLLNQKTQKVKIYSSLITPLTYMPFIRISYTIITPIQAVVNMSLPLILLINTISVLIVNYTMYTIGYINGKEVLQIIEVINKYAGLITIGLIAFVFISIYIKRKRNNIISEQ